MKSKFTVALLKSNSFAFIIPVHYKEFLEYTASFEEKDGHAIGGNTWSVWRAVKKVVR